MTDLSIGAGLPPLERARLAGELLQVRQQLAAGTLNPLDKVRASARGLELRALLGAPAPARADHDQAAFEKAREFYQQNLKARTIQSVIGPVLINGVGWRKAKLGMKPDPLKARLIEYVVEILEGGKAGPRELSYKERNDDFVAFYFIQKTVQVDDLLVTAGVRVGEREDGKLFYNVTHAGQKSWQAYENGAPDAAREVPRSGDADGGMLDTAEANVADDELNITILSVVPVSGSKLAEPGAANDPLQAELEASRVNVGKYEHLISRGVLTKDVLAAMDRHSAAFNAVEDAKVAAAWEAGKARPIGTANNKPHTIKAADALTPAGAIKADSSNSKADSAIWYYQGDIQQLSFTASIKIEGQAAAGAERAKAILAGLKAAKARGYKLRNLRAGRLGTVWVLETDAGGAYLTRAGFEDATNPVFDRPDMPEPMPGYESMLAQQTVLATAFIAWLDTLPYEQRHNQGVVSRKIGSTAVGDWVRMESDITGLYVQYRTPGSHQGIRIPGKDFDALIAECRRLANAPEIEPAPAATEAPKPGHPSEAEYQAAGEADAYAAKAIGFDSFSAYAAAREAGKASEVDFLVARGKYKIIEHLEKNGRDDKRNLESLAFQGANPQGPAALSTLRNSGFVLRNLNAKTGQYSLAPGVSLAAFIAGKVPENNPESLPDPASEAPDLAAPVKTAEAPAASSPEIIEYVTKSSGKTLRGIIRTDLTRDEAKAIDPHTWRMNGGYFIREKYLDGDTSTVQAAPAPVVLSAEQQAEQQARDERQAQERKQQALANQVSKLRAVADKAIADGSQSMNQDRLTNTSRRAGMAAAAIAQASVVEAEGRTLNSIADALEAGVAGSLAKLTSRAQLQELKSALSLAIYESDKGLSYSERQNVRGRAANESDLQRITFPVPLAWSRRFKDAALIIAKRQAQGNSRLIAALTKLSNNQERFRLTADADIAITRKAHKLLQSLGEGYTLKDTVDGLARVERLNRMGITSTVELQDACRALLPHLAARKEESAVAKAERAIIGQKVGIDFFPTPAHLAQRMARLARISKGDRVLEPSAGNGNLADAAAAAGASVDVIEISSQLRDILTAKGYTVVDHDFMGFTPEQPYQAIVMNPPFSKRQDAEHIMRAFGMLAGGGSLVAIAGEGVFFGQDQKAQHFRDWLDKHGAEVEALEGGTFQDNKLLAQTGANARLIVLRK